MFWHRCLILSLSATAASLAPKLGDGSDVDWWFAYKLNTEAFPKCSTEPKCIFGGERQDYQHGYGLQYLLSSHVDGSTTDMALNTDCLGSGDDPVAKTFEQIYGGSAPNYVIWNDQFYREPQLKLDPPCSTYSANPTSCSAPWAHSKGAIAWDESGNGFIMQVSTPDWPGSGTSEKKRPTQGNTLGCLKDDDVLVAQHFFALKLSADDTELVLKAMGLASVVTDPSNSQLVKLTKGPSHLADLARGLGKLDTSTSPTKATLSSGVKVLVKPQALNVPPWQMVSALVGAALRTATWWMKPEIPSTYAGTPGCWSDEMNGTPQEVQIATSGHWQGIEFGLTGGLGANYNHAKLGHSLNGTLAIMGDMNQQGSYTPEVRSCKSSQNGRGGMFFVVDDSTLHGSLKELMTGSTAAFFPSPGPSPGPSPSPSPGPGPKPHSKCGGAGTSSRDCRESSSKADGCVYVYSRDVSACNVTKYGCYEESSLPAGCPERSSSVIV